MRRRGAQAEGSAGSGMADFEVLHAEGTERARWLALLEAWEGAEVFAHPDYLSLFADAGSVAVLATWTDGVARVLQPLLLRDVRAARFWEGEAAWDTAGPPFGYAGPFVDGPAGVDADAAVERFFEAYAAWARDVGLVAEYVTFDPKRGAPPAYPGEVVARMPTVLRRTDMDAGDLWMDYKGSVRTDVRRARERGLRVTEDPTGEHAEAFLDVYEATMDRRDAASAYHMDRPLLDRIHERLAGWFIYFHCWEEDRIISTELVLLSGDSTFFFRGGTYRDRMRTRANLLLKHHVIQWTRESGRRFYLLGAGNTGEDALFRYKRSFAPRGVKDLHVGRWCLDPARYEVLTEARRAREAAAGRAWTPRLGFFPAYRAPGIEPEEAER